MENKAAPRMFALRDLRVVSIAALAAVLTLLVCLPGSAAAKRQSFVGHDGKIHACYRVKGKPKGMVRVVRGTRHRCRRGERRMAWSVTASADGAAGAAGTAGSSGGASSSSSTDLAALEGKVGALAFKVEALEGILGGISNGDLTGMLATLQGVTNADLMEAIDAAPLVATVCDQATLLTEQSNLLGEELDGLVTTLGGTILGAIFGGIEVPAALDPFSCT